MNPAELMQPVAYWPARAVLAAVELGVFAALARPATAEAVARACATDARATRMLLDALVGLQVLEVDAGHYAVVSGLHAALGGGDDSILPALFSLNMLVATPAGRSYEWNEVEGWLVELGVQRCTRVALPDGMSGLLIAER